MLSETDHEQIRLRQDTAAIRAQLANRMLHLLGDNDDLVTMIPGLKLTRRTRVLPPRSFLYEPSLAMMVCGSKHVMLGDTSYTYDESQLLLTAIDVPTITVLPGASPETPHLSVLLKLDLATARQMIATIQRQDPVAIPVAAGMATGSATVAMFDGVRRLLDLLDTPQAIPILSGLIHRELLYRLLTSPVGAQLRQTVTLGTQSNRVTQAISWLKDNYASPLRIQELARLSGMGVSTLHRHFRAMTAMSPLEFQKHLRLHEARRLMLNEQMDTASASLRVGYESATQFNREYRRLFGEPPLRDIRALRMGGLD